MGAPLWRPAVVTLCISFPLQKLTVIITAGRTVISAGDRFSVQKIMEATR
jgi:hypothetical protein